MFKEAVPENEEKDQTLKTRPKAFAPRPRVKQTQLEPRQFKNNLTMFESKLILKLPPFSLTYTARENLQRIRFIKLPSEKGGANSGPTSKKFWILCFFH